MTHEANSISDAPFKRKKEAKPPKKITETYLTNSGKYYLERFPASTEQFRRVMSRKINKSCKAHQDQNPETCFTALENVIRKFQEIGFLNDAGYAAGLARSLKNRGWPRSRILMRLKEKGISADIIDEAVEEAAPDEDFRNALIWMRRKRLGAFATTEKTQDKSLAALARAGFDYHTASRALELSKDEIVEILEGHQD